MRSLSWIIWWFLNASTSVLVRGRQREITDRWREGNPRAEIGALQPQAQESRFVGKSEKRILPGASGGGQVCPHLDFGLSVHIKSLSLVRLFATLWTVAHQVLLSIGFSRHEYWNGLPSPPPRDLPDPGIEPVSLLCFLLWQEGSLTPDFRFLASRLWENKFLLF